MMSNIVKEFYAAKTSGDSIRFMNMIEIAKRAGYAYCDGEITETDAVRELAGAPQAGTPPAAAAAMPPFVPKFGGTQPDEDDL